MQQLINSHRGNRGPKAPSLWSNQTGGAKLGDIPGLGKLAKDGDTGVTIQNPTDSSGVSISDKKQTAVKLNAARLDLPKSIQKQIEKDTAKLVDTMSNKEIADLAKRAGLDLKTNSDAKVKQEIAQQLNARRQSVELERKAMQMQKAGASVDEVAAVIKQSRELQNISSQQGREIARQLQARRITANEMNTPLQRVLQLLDNAGVEPEAAARRMAEADFEDANSVVKAYRDLVPPHASEWLDVVRYNSMLSSPTTHIINMASNAIQVGAVAPIEKTLAGTLDSLFHPLDQSKRTKYAGEGVAYIKGSTGALNDAAQKFIDTMRGKQSVENLDMRHNVPLATDGKAKIAYDALSFPMKMLEASDQFFRTLAVAGETESLEYKQSKGVKIANVEETANKAAAHRIFRQELNDASQGTMLGAIDDFTNHIMMARNSKNGIVRNVAKWTLPFVQTPMNVFKQGVEYSPLGFGTIAGSQDKTTQATRAIMGSMVFMGAATLLGAGRLTWKEPYDPEEKARWRAEGKQPYAIKVGDHWVAMSKMPPVVAFPFAAVAAIDDAVQSGKMGEDVQDQIIRGIAQYGEFLGDQSYTKTIGDMLAGIRGDSEKFAQMVSNYPQQLVPFRALTGWFARMTDDYDRTIDPDGSYLDKQVQLLMQQYPGARQNTPAREYAGQPIPSNNPGLNAISPYRITDDRSSDIQVSNAQTNGVTISNSPQAKKDAKRELTGMKQAAENGSGDEFGLQQLADGRYAAQIGNEVKTFADLDKAQAAIAKEGFANSDERIKILGDTVYYKNSDGEVKTKSTIQYTYEQADAKLDLEMDRAKDSNDIEAWFGYAEQKVQALEAKKALYDPVTEADEINKIVLAQENILQQAEKYQEYGGFKKGRSGRGKGLPNISVGISSDLMNPIVASSSYRAPNVQLRSKGSPGVRVRRSSVKINAPRKLA